MWATIMILVVALMAPPVKPQFNTWSSSPSFDTKGHCEFTLFVSANVPYYWTIDQPEPSRMNEDPITGIDSQPFLLADGYSSDVNIRVFLDPNQKYGKPTWEWTHTLVCIVPESKRSGWTQPS